MSYAIFAETDRGWRLVATFPTRGAAEAALRSLDDPTAFVSCVGTYATLGGLV
jgi:hypothetical protein